MFEKRTKFGLKTLKKHFIKNVLFRISQEIAINFIRLNIVPLGALYR
jgi:hypothetical protein